MKNNSGGLALLFKVAGKSIDTVSAGPSFRLLSGA
jgi:hypothetical protein